jgi:uncharacterized protein
MSLPDGSDAAAGGQAAAPIIDVHREAVVSGRGRYVITVDGGEAGFSTFALREGRLTFLHTEVDPAFAGRGLGNRLAAGALDDARANGWRVRPLCPFIAAYIERHPELADLVG